MSDVLYSRYGQFADSRMDGLPGGQPAGEDFDLLGLVGGSLEKHDKEEEEGPGKQDYYYYN